ncbi:galactokinase [Sphingobacterium chungjuense]|uniref:galactokinase n=1 Tax=Sphingobacterium chungjuense TaxID=2675553 RepID=UPI00140954A5|nr:galactokinase [Sphingobacterium chungjuense]
MGKQNTLKERYQALFGAEPDLMAKSPGRINLIGEHTDYNEGFVLPTAIDKAIYVAVAARDDDKIVLYAEDFSEYFESTVDTVSPSDKGWPNYILGVVDQLNKLNLAVKGFNLYVDGDVPLGAGLSSSAAVECATGFALNELFHFGLSRQEIAKIGQMAEHTFAGVKCGIMDQFASVLSKEDFVIKLDCRSLEYEHVPLLLGDYELVLFNTNVKHSLASSAYNDRRNSCEQGVAWLQKAYPDVLSLRDATVEMLEAVVKPKDEEVFTKCKYVVEENIRVELACEALKSGNIEEMGRQMFVAHQAISQDYQVSCAELDFLVDYMKNQPEAVGARMMGGGFGGCTINIVQKGHAERIARQVSPAYKEAFGLELEPIFVAASGGSTLLA